MNKTEQEYLVEKIRTQYTKKEHTELDSLRKLDKKVKAPANCFAYIFGSISALIMGTGMSLIMTDIGQYIEITDTQTCGLITGILGMLMAISTYPIYKKILSSRRKKYAESIILLSNKILNS